jgi:molybdopterin molybdotransferase
MEGDMITPKTAQRLIARRVARLAPASLPIADALGHVLAADVHSPVDLPRFDNSAMDGFALRSGDTGAATPAVPVRLSIAFTVHAGDPARRWLRPGEACGIMTGARVPGGADAILPRELAVVQGSTLAIRRPVEPSRHIRPRGEDVPKGARVLKNGAVVHPGTVAVLAAMGRSRVRVVRKPVVSVITTGDEAMPPGTRLTRGQIYDSNSPMLMAMLKSMGIHDVSCRHVTDRPGLLAKAIRGALARSDVLVVVGGVSVGDRDYVRPVLRDEGVKRVFWQVAQKPGKPLYFGVRGRRLVFGLPGNPASAFTCFYVYVYPALRRMSGFRNAYLHARAMRPSRAVTPDRKKWRLLKARVERGAGPVVTELPGQGSHRVASLAATNSLIVVPPGAVARDGDLETLEIPLAEDP